MPVETPVIETAPVETAPVVEAPIAAPEPEVQVTTEQHLKLLLKNQQ